MTSNLGAKEILNTGSKLGFTGEKSADNAKDEFKIIKERVMEELKRTFRPEFLNRIDDIIVFERLSEENIRAIARLMLKELTKRLAANEINAEFSEAAVAEIAKEGYDPTYGARPLRRAIQSKIEDMLSEEIIDGKITAGDDITVEADADAFKVIKKEAARV